MVLLIGAPYTIIPLLLVYRMWKPDPFGPNETISAVADPGS
jgi:hypothetical protein